MLKMTFTFDPLRPLGFASGTYTGYHYDPRGAVVASRRGTLSRASMAHVDEWAVINGKAMIRVTDGVWAGYWLQLASGLNY